MSDSGMFDFDDLEAKSPSEASGEVPIDYRGEDAHERFRIAELRNVQENVKKIEAVDDVDDDGECPYLDGQFSDTRTRTLPMLHLFLDVELRKSEFGIVSDDDNGLIFECVA